MFRCSFVGYGYVYKVCILLLGQSLKYYTVLSIIQYYSSLSLRIAFVLKSAFPDITIVTPAFLQFPFSWSIFSILALSVCVYHLLRGGSLVDSIYLGQVFLSIQLPSVFWLEHLICLHLKLLIVTDLLPFYFYPNILFLFFLLNEGPLTFPAILFWCKWTFYLFIFRERRTEGEREGANNQCERGTPINCLLDMPWPGIEPATPVCTLTRNRTGDLSLCRTMPNQLSHTSQGPLAFLFVWEALYFVFSLKF